MTPYEAVREEFELPFEPYPFQIEHVNELCGYDRSGFYWEPGTGKTLGVTLWCLYLHLTQGVQQFVLPMPPILVLQWSRWLAKIKHRRTGLPLSCTPYMGTPKQRRALNMDNMFIPLSYGLLKNDKEFLADSLQGKRYAVALDEGHAIKNIESEVHKTCRDFSEGRELAILTGTPLTTPMDAYAYVKLIAPNIYRNKRQFEKIHIGEKDDWGKITKWDNLDLLASNMRVQTSRVLRRDVKKELPPVTYSTLVYDLAPAHLALYNRIAAEKLVEFEDGREINAISVQALRSALQQVVLNWGHFEDDDTKTPAAMDLIDEVFDELGPTSKLAVVANFVRSNTYLLAKLAPKYGAVALYGEVSAKEKQKAITRFIEDPACRCIILQPQSAGFGVDGLQHVCSDLLVLEAPTTAPPFEQVVKRFDRDGQTQPVNCRIAVANRTVQVRMFKNLLENDALINKVQGGYQDLKEALYGN